VLSEHSPNAKANRCGIAFALASILSAVQVHAVAAQSVDASEPRIVLSKQVRSAFQKAATRRDSVIAGNIATCDFIIATPEEYKRSGYMGTEWGKALQNCLLAWAGTGKSKYADAALTYFNALLDDEKQVGDGAGGDSAITRDSG
jgi:hypothetical protein